MEKEANRLPSNCAGKDNLETMLEEITTQLFCLDEEHSKSALMFSLVGLRSCIECYQTTIGDDEYISNFVTSYDNLVLQASEDLHILCDNLFSLISLYNTDFKTINEHINKLLELEPVLSDKIELNYSRDKSAINALAQLL